MCPMSEEPLEEKKLPEPDDFDDDRPRFKPLNAVGIVLLLAAMGVAFWQADKDNQRILEARARQEADQGGAPARVKPVVFPLDLNSATVRELDQLPGIGEKYAREIVRLRDQKGSFTSINELMEISGIGEKTLDQIRGLVSINAPPEENTPAP